ncbi:hypothetical protein ZHAS_00000604 [Anopheles sinensis]|uniref:Uncharacterized protein n=1 Tax=Anopheles sinensis TaxID=74873 RepID=A0A084VAC5_ANOSI|nr:hypothetical protein ZHAS_00000604 [Anopheles sinensis]
MASARDFSLGFLLFERNGQIESVAIISSISAKLASLQKLANTKTSLFARTQTLGGIVTSVFFFPFLFDEGNEYTSSSVGTRGIGYIYSRVEHMPRACCICIGVHIARASKKAVPHVFHTHTSVRPSRSKSIDRSEGAWFV